MRCEACGSKVSVNYGNAYTTLCKNCSDTETGHNKLKKEKMLEDKINKGSIMQINKWVEVLGVASSIFGILVMVIGIAQSNFSSLLSGILIITFGVGTYAFGNIIPYIVSIETCIRTLKDELVEKNKSTKGEKE